MSMDRGASPQNALYAFLLFVASFGLTWSPTASAQALTYCYGAACYANLSEAEAAMKAASVYGSLLRPNGRSALNASRDFTLYYTVDEQGPVRYWTSHAMPGYDTNMPGCGSGNPIRPGSCSTEQQAVDVFWNSTNPYKPAECAVGMPSIDGQYIEPYRYSITSVQSGVSYGEFHFEEVIGGGRLQPQHTFRRMQYTVACPGFTPFSQFYSLQKSVVYECPKGFSATAVGVNDPKPAIYGTKWCKPGTSMPTIKAKLRQYESCPVNNHPCFPGTGDKMRVESDFTISGWTFSRIYHSLAELDGGAISRGWSTTFSERVVTGSTLAYINSSAFYESLVPMSGGGRYRSAVHPQRVLEVLGSPTTGYRVTNGTEIKEFDASGKLIKLQDANDGGRKLELVYTGTLLTEVRTAQGRRASFAYEGGRLSSIVLPDGADIAYGFDASGNLSTVRQGATVRTYIYGESDKSPSNKPHLLTGIIDETGQRYASFYYDSDGRVTGSHLHGGQGPVEATTVQYSGADSVYVSTAAGRLRTHRVITACRYRSSTNLARDQIRTLVRCSRRLSIRKGWSRHMSTTASCQLSKLPRTRQSVERFHIHAMSWGASRSRT